MSQDHMHSSQPTNPPDLTTLRDHQANERTFLAWIRSAISFIGLGFVLAKMGFFLQQLALASGALRSDASPSSAPGRIDFQVTGMVFLLLGTAIGGWAGWHYHQVRKGIEAGLYRPARTITTAMAVLVVLGGLVVAAIMLRTLMRYHGGS